MDDVAYPDVTSHKQRHLDFLDQFRCLRDRLEQDGATFENIGALANAVETWVAKHVLDEDRRLAEFIRNR